MMARMPLKRLPMALAYSSSCNAVNFILPSVRSSLRILYRFSSRHRRSNIFIHYIRIVWVGKDAATTLRTRRALTTFEYKIANDTTQRPWCGSHSPPIIFQLNMFCNAGDRPGKDVPCSHTLHHPMRQDLHCSPVGGSNLTSQSVLV